MFRSLDAMIGFTTVLLVLSLIVTVLTQIVANALKLRTRCLRDGVLEIFRQLNWEFAGNGAQLLAHDLVLSRDAVAREVLLEKMLVLAQKHTPPACAELKNKIEALAPGFDPQMLLSSLRRRTLELSVERSDLTAAAVRSMAMAGTPVAVLASEVFGVFDSTMDAVSARLTWHSRKLVALFAILLAVAVPLDTFDLLRRLARGDDARDRAGVLASAIAQSDSGDHSTPQDLRAAAAMLQAMDAIVVPASRVEWLARWQKVNWVGVAGGALLLNLGAPFWFAVLKDLLKLRSTAAGQESQDRAQRQTAGTNLPPPAAGVGEQGDLQAAG